MAKCHCGRPKLPEAPNCGEGRCVAMGQDLDAGRAERTWRHLMIRRGNDFVALSKDASIKALQGQRRIHRQVMHENLQRSYERMRIEDRLEDN